MEQTLDMFMCHASHLGYIKKIQFLVYLEIKGNQRIHNCWPPKIKTVVKGRQQWGRKADSR